jgi:deferrochelatase/peroxidase EfeB
MTMPDTRDIPVPADGTVDKTIENEDPIASPGPHDRLLERLQGNILRGHGRDFTVNIVLSFNEKANADQIRQEIKRLASTYVTSAARQLVEAKEYRTNRLPGALFGNLFLTRNAYVRLKQECVLSKFVDDRDLHRVNFVTGMKGGADTLGDRIVKPAEPLEVAYANEQIDAMLLLADDSEQYLLRTARHEIDRIHERGVATVVAVERGEVLRNARGDGIEHFGYVDGRSQPLFLASDFIDLDEKGKIVPGRTKERMSGGVAGDIKHWNPFAKLSLALLKDPGSDDPDAYGSYYVFRKLEQDVRGFALAEMNLARALKLQGDDCARAGAMAVGRFRDGTPLVLNDAPSPRHRLANDFRYDGVVLNGAQSPNPPIDTYGVKCPFQAHIRKVSPRQSEAREDFMTRRIVRRGITYGERTGHDMSKVEGLPSEGVGLLFASFQASIARQFGFIQVIWSNSPLFAIDGTYSSDAQTGVDALIGQARTVLDQHWRREYDGTIPCQPPNLKSLCLPLSHETPFTFNGFVKFRGGEFFFAPSLSFLGCI